MKSTHVQVLVLAGLLGSSAIAIAAEPTDTDRGHPGAFVKDSAITTKIKAKLAAEHVMSLGQIHVDTDKTGEVWLSGFARTEEAVEKAMSIARGTENVTAVHSEIRIKKDD